jgi:hypothetical protein
MRLIMRTRPAAISSLFLAFAALPAMAQATGGAGSATAGGTQSPGNANAGVTTDYASGKSSVTPANPASVPASPATNAAAPGLTPDQNRMGSLPRQNGGGNYERRGTRDTGATGTSQQNDR